MGKLQTQGTGWLNKSGQKRAWWGGLEGTCSKWEHWYSMPANTCHARTKPSCQTFSFFNRNRKCGIHKIHRWAEFDTQTNRLASACTYVQGVTLVVSFQTGRWKRHLTWLFLKHLSSTYLWVRYLWSPTKICKWRIHILHQVMHSRRIYWTAILCDATCSLSTNTSLKQT